MASVIKAGNATDGIQVTADNTGILELKTGTGSGTTALTLSSSQNATIAGTLQVAGVSTNMYPLVSDTVKTASGTSVEFTSIPSWAKRVTVMFSGLSTNSTNTLKLQIGSGSYSTSGYASYVGAITSSSTASYAAITDGIYIAGHNAATDTTSGVFTLVNLTGNTWGVTGTCVRISATITVNTTSMVPFALGGALDRLRIIGSASGNPSDTFDAGSINIMWE